MKWALLVLALAAVIAVASGRRPEAAPPHQQWARGECADCHVDADAPSGAPAHHLDPLWSITHGRQEGAAPTRCLQCHTAKACRDCHQRRPESHTFGFMRPHTAADARRHALLGRLRPSSCMLCHSAPARDCVGCHTATEARGWAEEAAPILSTWPELRP